MPRPARTKTAATRSSPKIGASNKGLRLREQELPPWGMSSRSDYQRRICELEMELSRLREDKEELRCQAEMLKSSRDHYVSLYQTAPSACVTVDELGKVVQCNQEFLELVGMTDERPRDIYFGRLLMPEDIRRFRGHLQLARRSARPVHCKLRLRSPHDGVPVELISIKRQDDTFQPGLVQMTVLDLTERLKEQELRAKTQSDFKALVDTIQGVVWEADPDSLELTYVSSRAEQLLAYPWGYWAKGLTWESHIYIEDRDAVAAAMRTLASTRRDTTVEYRMVRADRRVIWVSNSMCTAVIGQKLRLLGVVIDISDRKEAEEQLRVARDQLEQRVHQRTVQLRETVSDLEAFSYTLSHDLRAPLRAMQGYAQLLLNRLAPALDQSGRAYFQRLMSSAERLDRLIQDVLRFSRVSRIPVELRSIDLERLLDDVINDYPILLPPKVEIQVQRPLLPVRGHEAFLTQCMSNLLSNAVKFKRPGEMAAIKVSTRRSKGGTVRLSFEDNGIGIAPEDQKRIFGIFERVHSDQLYEGTGIGLAIVARAVERMGGHVGVESAVGHGSRFWLDLPASTP